MHFTGEATQATDGTWRGEGTFTGTLNDEPIIVHLNVNGGDIWLDGDIAGLWGGADVTYMGTVTSDVPFYAVSAHDPSRGPTNLDAFVMILDGPGTDGSHLWLTNVLHGAVNII